MSKYEQRAILLSALAALTGLGMASYFHGGHWFGRSGAVITAIAIIFTAFELRERLAKTPSFVEEQIKRSRPDLMKQGAAAGLDQSAAEAVVSKVESEVRTEVADVARQASRRLLRVEVSLLVVGTLIWGFGDLPLGFMFKQQVANPSINSDADDKAAGAGYVKR